ncbi:nitroreductase family deazaflavin-dependent oxidoreductase [Nocardia sp. 2]|uniref:Nitroreductase family deazaflavin-dependent oxidoreductase n=2 Tax=Nocardia acididurans TaxID=2802282 RepID=A0ABS1M4G6_9NOCA|nr:nitroreductase family deazaflavin-dependent oxidoreductase [Nocardia acididurans]
MPWFPVWQPRGTGVLTTRGRKSGVARHTPVKAARDGDRAFLVSIGGKQAQWYRNLRADSRVRLQLPSENGWPGGVFEGIARELRDDNERAEAYAALCERVYPFDWVENLAHRRGLPTRAKIVELHRSWFVCGHPLVIELGAAPVSRQRWPFVPRNF